MIHILVVGEGVTDPPLVCGLTDRILQGAIDWLRDQDLEHHRRYRGLGSREYVRWGSVPKLHKRVFIRGTRGFGATGLPPDRRATRKLFQLIQAAVLSGEAIDAVLIFRDADDQPERHDGIQRARRKFIDEGGAGPWSGHVAIGVANPKNEAWILAGFDPRDDAERTALRAMRRELGFEPHRAPERLTAGDRDPGSKKTAKGVLDQLCPDHDRRRACWEQTPLEMLEERGERCGLTAFLAEVREHIASRFSARTAR